MSQELLITIAVILFIICAGLYIFGRR